MGNKASSAYIELDGLSNPRNPIDEWNRHVIDQIMLRKFKTLDQWIKEGEPRFNQPRFNTLSTAERIMHFEELIALNERQQKQYIEEKNLVAYDSVSNFFGAIPMYDNFKHRNDELSFRDTYGFIRYFETPEIADIYFKQEYSRFFLDSERIKYEILRHSRTNYTTQLPDKDLIQFKELGLDPIKFQFSPYEFARFRMMSFAPGAERRAHAIYIWGILVLCAIALLVLMIMLWPHGKK